MDGWMAWQSGWASLHCFLRTVSAFFESWKKPHRQQSAVYALPRRAARRSVQCSPPQHPGGASEVPSLEVNSADMAKGTLQAPGSGVLPLLLWTGS